MSEQSTAAADLRDALRQAAPQGIISCETARKLAEEWGVPYKQVGQTATELGIKIKSCQLGCF